MFELTGVQQAIPDKKVCDVW